ncbi:MAG: cobalt transporter CbiM [Spirochaetaceae bacterium]|jgi:cobalt/nickel transport system permease protein|nr:cobalt transporter CbiM [Spirochaetaceae bacterium]
MHISEGVLSPPVLAAGWALAAGGLAWGLKKTKTGQLPETALVSAALFLASLVHVPLGPSSVHLTLLGVAGILLRWRAVPALFIALFLQGFLFQFGGLLSLGVNTAVMGSAALTGSLVFRFFPEKWRLPGAFAGGFTAVITGTALVSLALFISGGELWGTAVLLFAANIPLALVEGVISLFITAFLARMLPGYVSRPS